MQVTRRSFPLLLAAVGTTGIARAAPGGGDAVAHNRRLIERYFDEVWNRGRLDVLDELLAPDYVNHTPSTPNPPPGPDGLKPIVAAIRRGFPDLRFRIDDIVATPDRVVARTLMTGTHLGPLFGTPPTRRRIAVMQMNIERVEAGRIVEHWRVTDELGLRRQLGLVS